MKPRTSRANPIEVYAQKCIAHGVIVQTDGLNAYRKPLYRGYIHEREVFNPDSNLLKYLHHMIDNTKTFINGIYHAISTKYLQMYLSEFCYRFNCGFFNGAIFDSLHAVS